MHVRAEALYEQLAAYNQNIQTLDRRHVAEEEALQLIQTWIEERSDGLRCLEMPWQQRSTTASEPVGAACIPWCKQQTPTTGMR